METTRDSAQDSATMPFSKAKLVNLMMESVIGVGGGPGSASFSHTGVS